jgi:hypothetical protein
MRNEREWPAWTYRFAHLISKQYAYSTWAPQFAERLKLSSTESNLIVCPTDAFSTQLLTRRRAALATLGCTFRQYWLELWLIQKDHGLAWHSAPSFWELDTLPSTLVCLDVPVWAEKLTFSAFKTGPGSFGVASLCFFSFLTGCGSCAAFLAALKTGEMKLQKVQKSYQLTLHSCYQLPSKSRNRNRFATRRLWSKRFHVLDDLHVRISR